VNQITLLKYPDRVLVLYGRIKASSIINYVQMLTLTL
jgi:(2Fe-2S) ferredoxin